MDRVDPRQRPRFARQRADPLRVREGAHGVRRPAHRHEPGPVVEHLIEVLEPEPPRDIARFRATVERELRLDPEIPDDAIEAVRRVRSVLWQADQHIQHAVEGRAGTTVTGVWLHANSPTSPFRFAPPQGFKLMEGMYYNEYFPGHQIKMPPPLSPDQLKFADKTPAKIGR